MADTTLTWLGHSAFRIDTSGGRRIYVDPFLNGNPTCPPGEQSPERVDIVAVTHGHGDHVGDTVALSQQHGAKVVAQVELSGWLGRQGVDEGSLVAPNKGGTVDVNGVKFTLTNAFHSNSTPDGSYGGEAAGYVVETENGTKLYFAGDTCVFGDMQLIGRISRSRHCDPADRRPLHDGPRGGRRARAPRREPLRPLPLGHVPGPDGATRRAAGARSRGAGRAPRTGRVGDRVRERWFGATGQRVSRSSRSKVRSTPATLSCSTVSATSRSCARHSKAAGPSSCGRPQPRRSRRPSRGLRCRASSSRPIVPTCSTST